MGDACLRHGGNRIGIPEALEVTMNPALPLRYNGAITLDAEGIPCDHATRPFYAAEDPIRRMERASIRWWMERQREYLKGRVLDFGAGKPGTCYQPQPYRDLVDGEYVPIDIGDEYPDGEFDAILCTQMLNYCGPVSALQKLRQSLKVGGHMVITYPSNWTEIEEDDLWRYTRAGMSMLLNRYAPMEIVTHDLRATVHVGNFTFPLGYGVVARKPCST